MLGLQLVVWEGLGGVTLLEEVELLGVGFEVSKTYSFPARLPFSDSCLWIRCNLSVNALAPFLAAAMLSAMMIMD